MKDILLRQLIEIWTYHVKVYPKIGGRKKVSTSVSGFVMTKKTNKKDPTAIFFSPALVLLYVYLHIYLSIYLSIPLFVRMYGDIDKT